VRALQFTSGFKEQSPQHKGFSEVRGPVCKNHNPEYVILWNLDETLILHNSLKHDLSYKTQSHRSSAPHCAARMSSILMEVLSKVFHYDQFESLDQTKADSLISFDDGKEIRYPKKKGVEEFFLL
jgi:hypothetical protein